MKMHLKPFLRGGPEVIRYTLVAICGLGIDITIAWGLLKIWNITLMFSATMGFFSGAVFNYIMHELWTFQSGFRRLSVNRAFSYFLSLWATLSVRLITVALLSFIMLAGQDLAILVISAGMSFFVNFAIIKLMVFNKKLITHPAKNENGNIKNVIDNHNITFDSTSWQIPTYDIALYGEKQESYALVIPVINEGDRIQSQLERITAAAPEVDVVVADGGSTDESLNANFISTLCVRAVLTKTGPGRLSAQLRMAYAWCLQEGYTGIITMDGNGKDGIEAIDLFVQALEGGTDYAQGSRYAKGGKAERTPLERTIANRLIHAPLLSLAARHWFTDTTNGFRAYSSGYLLHPRVKPFRDIFMRYELLFYLTVRAGQLGVNICQVPVSRSYPCNLATPTKISGIKGKFDVLCQCFAAAFGKFKP